MEVDEGLSQPSEGFKTSVVCSTLVAISVISLVRAVVDFPGVIVVIADAS